MATNKGGTDGARRPRRRRSSRWGNNWQVRRATPGARRGSRLMPPVLTVIRWRHLPAQVTAKDGRRTAKRVLHRRFQVAIDRAAMKAGKKGFSEYIGEWVSDRRACTDDLEAEVAAAADRLEHDHTRHVLAELITNGGWRDPAAHPANATASAPGGAEIEGAPTPEEATAPAAEEPA